MYSKFLKRVIDFTCSLIAMIILSPVFWILIITGWIVMKGNPFFVQKRPGKGEKIFNLIKFCSMTNERDADGKLLPDEKRLTRYGSWIRATSLDELPELINILKGDMSFVGPRPLLVRDMLFMTAEQRKRHTVRQGLTGLAQVNGRNNITWEKKMEYDLQYIENGITFWGDLKIIIQTVITVFKKSDVVREGTVSDVDLGDWLLGNGTIDQAMYDEKQAEAIELLKV